VEIRRRAGRKGDGKDVKKGGEKWEGEGEGRERESEKRVGGRGIMSEGGTSWRPHDGICKYDLFVSGMIEGR
jgi:hypothetical protein